MQNIVFNHVVAHERFPGKRVAIMQPYFFPYVGYFQLISAVDQFVVYDDIKYTKKGWINRNRILRDGDEMLFSLPLKGASDSYTIVEREISTDYEPQRLMKQIQVSYHRAPYFSMVEQTLFDILFFPEKNLFSFLRNSLEVLCTFLNIETELITSSKVEIDHAFKGEDKVIEICKTLNAKHYVNLPGGKTLYSDENFRKNSISLSFIEPNCRAYPQFNGSFQPSLSIIDLLMFNTKKELERVIRNDYSLT